MSVTIEVDGYKWAVESQAVARHFANEIEIAIQRNSHVVYRSDNETVLLNPALVGWIVVREEDPRQG